jgi:hypothetical protein
MHCIIHGLIYIYKVYCHIQTHFLFLDAHPFAAPPLTPTRGVTTCFCCLIRRSRCPLRGVVWLPDPTPDAHKGRHYISFHRQRRSICGTSLATPPPDAHKGRHYIYISPATPKCSDAPCGRQGRGGGVSYPHSKTSSPCCSPTSFPFAIFLLFPFPFFAPFSCNPIATSSACRS